MLDASQRNRGLVLLAVLFIALRLIPRLRRRSPLAAAAVEAAAASAGLTEEERSRFLTSTLASAASQTISQVNVELNKFRAELGLANWNATYKARFGTLGAFVGINNAKYNTGTLNQKSLAYAIADEVDDRVAAVTAEAATRLASDEAIEDKIYGTPRDDFSYPMFSDVFYANKSSILADSDSASGFSGPANNWPQISYDPRTFGLKFSRYTRKVNYYFYANDRTTSNISCKDVTLGDLKSFTFDGSFVHTDGATSSNEYAYIIVYTEPKNDGTDRASWYNMRLMYLNSGNRTGMFDPTTAPVFTVDISYDPSYFIYTTGVSSVRWANQINRISTSASAADKIRYISVHTDSSTVRKFDFTLRSVSLELYNGNVKKVPLVYGLTNGIINLDGSLAAENAARIAKDDALEAALNIEITNRANADTDIIENKIGTMLYDQNNYLYDSETLTYSLNKLDIALRDVANTVNGGQYTDITALNARAGMSVYPESSYNYALESGATFNLTTAVKRLDDALKSERDALYTNIDAEAAARAAADTAEAAARTAAITAEATTRASADATLQSNIDAEAAARAAADAAEAAARTAAITAESTARTTAVATLQSNIDAEAAARIAGDVAEAAARAAAEAARAKTKHIDYDGLYAWQGGVTEDTAGISPLQSLRVRSFGLLMHPSFGTEVNGQLTGKLADLHGNVHASNIGVGFFYSFMSHYGVPEPKYLDEWKNGGSFANFRTAYYKLTAIAEKAMQIPVRTAKDNMVTVSFSFDLRYRWLMSAIASASVDYYYVDSNNVTQYVYNAEKIAQIATDDVTQIDLRVMIDKSSNDMTAERTYNFVLRGQGLTAPGESFPIMSDSGTTLVGDELTLLGKLRRTMNAIQQAGLGVHPKAIRDLAKPLAASKGLYLVNNTYYITYAYPSHEEAIYFANRQPAWIFYDEQMKDIAGNPVGDVADYGTLPCRLDIFENWTVFDFFYMFYSASAYKPTEGVLAAYDDTLGYIDVPISLNGSALIHDGKPVKARVYRYATHASSDAQLFIHDAMRRMDSPVLFGPPQVPVVVRVEEFDAVGSQVFTTLNLTADYLEKIANKLDSNVSFDLFDFDAYGSFDELFYDEYTIVVTAPSYSVVDYYATVSITLTSTPKLSGREEVTQTYTVKKNGSDVTSSFVLAGDLVLNQNIPLLADGFSGSSSANLVFTEAGSYVFESKLIKTSDAAVIYASDSKTVNVIPVNSTHTMSISPMAAVNVGDNVTFVVNIGTSVVGANDRVNATLEWSGDASGSKLINVLYKNGNSEEFTVSFNSPGTKTLAVTLNDSNGGVLATANTTIVVNEAGLNVLQLSDITGLSGNMLSSYKYADSRFALAYTKGYLEEVNGYYYEYTAVGVIVKDNGEIKWRFAGGIGSYISGTNTIPNDAVNTVLKSAFRINWAELGWNAPTSQNNILRPLALENGVLKQDSEGMYSVVFNNSGGTYETPLYMLPAPKFATGYDFSSSTYVAWRNYLPSKATIINMMNYAGGRITPNYVANALIFSSGPFELNGNYRYLGFVYDDSADSGAGECKAVFFNNSKNIEGTYNNGEFIFYNGTPYTYYRYELTTKNFNVYDFTSSNMPQLSYSDFNNTSNYFRVFFAQTLEVGIQLDRHHVNLENVSGSTPLQYAKIII